MKPQESVITTYLHIYHSRVVTVYGLHGDEMAMVYHHRNPLPDKDNLQYHVYQTCHIYHRKDVVVVSYFQHCKKENLLVKKLFSSDY